MNIIIPTSDSDLLAKVRAHLRSSVDNAGAERRFTTGIVERRAAASGAAARFGGYAAMFNSRSENFGSEDYPYFELIEPGFFDDCLQDDIRCLFNHDENLILGRSVKGKGTCRVTQDATGLAYECESSERSYAKDLEISLDRKDVTQSSFAFRTKEDGDKLVIEDGVVVRTLKKGGCARLYDVSPVTYPAYADTEVSLRELRGLRKAKAPAVAAVSQIPNLRRRLDLAASE
jgi:HK97 family phage prohead protease